MGSICSRARVQLGRLSWEPENRALQLIRIALPVELFGNSLVVFGSPLRYMPSLDGANGAVSSGVKSCGGDKTAAETAEIRSRAIGYIFSEGYQDRRDTVKLRILIKCM